MATERRFRGIERLYGLENYNKLKNAHVCVVGLGGVGSWVVEALARSGVGELTIIDLDNVAESNINRQLPALTTNFGKPKVMVMEERLLDINPHIRVNSIEDFVEESNYQTIFSKPLSFVIDAIDQLKIKVMMANYFMHHNQPFVVSGGAGGKISASKVALADLSQVTHDALLANMRYQLRKKFMFPRQGKMKINCVYSAEQQILPEQCSTEDLENGLNCAGYGASMVVTATFAMHLTQQALKVLLNEQ